MIGHERSQQAAWGLVCGRLKGVVLCDFHGASLSPRGERRNKESALNVAFNETLYEVA